MTKPAIDVRYVAKLARIELTDQEVRRFEVELGSLLDHMHVLDALDVAEIPATAQVVESRNVTRDDLVGPCLDRDVVLAEAPRSQGPFFRVPRIIAE
jgi:aspartyl-tRNA(Asn)/glutamyl-tRNA(Gln) amidotransferase subunit C